MGWRWRRLVGDESIKNEVTGSSLNQLSMGDGSCKEQEEEMSKLFTLC